MSFTLFDTHDISTFAAFRGFLGVGYIIFVDRYTGTLYYKSFTGNVNSEISQFVTDNPEKKIEISFYANPYGKEIFVTYTVENGNIYVVLMEEVGLKLNVKKSDTIVKKLNNEKTELTSIFGRQPIGIFDPYANSYGVFYVDNFDNKFYKIFINNNFEYVNECQIVGRPDKKLYTNPDGTWKESPWSEEDYKEAAKNLFNVGLTLDVEPMFGSNFRNITLAATILANNGYYNAYGVSYIHNNTTIKRQ